MNSITRAHPFRLLGTTPQATTGNLYTAPSIRQHAPGNTTTALLEGLNIASFEIQNRSGSTVSTGIGGKLPNRLWIAGQWVDADATPYTDDTTDAQDTGAGDFVLETLTNSDGFVIASLEPFNAVSLDIGTASDGGVVRALRYTNSTGDGWINLTNPFIHDGASTTLAVTGTTIANESLIVFDVPTDWGQVATGGLSGIPAGYYALNVRATTAPTTAAIADSLAICRLYFLQEGVTDNTTVFRDYAGKVRRMPFCTGLVALFGTADPQNHVTAEVESGT